ncbi:MAG: MBL fold metallo-hydrolase [Sedimentisphaerales bacterium]|nr:MBL fold metallo-hydrolase [Sedimentisphaerales bacterium]
MNIQTIALGDFETNCYILRGSANETDCLLIDPGFEPEPLLDYLQKNRLTPRWILLTHGHSDHIAGIAAVQKAFGEIPIGIGAKDADMLTSAMRNLSFMMGRNVELPAADKLYQAGDVVGMSEINLKVLATPGHTPGGISFYSETDSVVFTGDALFAESVGRTDFPGGDGDTLLESIRRELLTLPEATKVYPGHGPATTIGREKRLNPFFAGRGGY